MTMDPKKTELTSLFYSLGIHFFVVSFLLTLPISKGEVSLQSFSEIIVYPVAEKGDAVPAAPQKLKTVIPMIRHTERAEKKPAPQRGTKSVKARGGGPDKESALKRPQVPKAQAAMVPEKREAVETAPVQARPAVTKSVESTRVEVPPVPTAPTEELSELKEEAATELLTEAEETIEENTEREPDIAAKTAPIQRPQAPVIVKKPLRMANMSRLMPLQPTTNASEAKIQGGKKAHGERGGELAAKKQPVQRPPAPVIAEDAIKMGYLSRVMPVQPETIGEEKKTARDKEEEGPNETTPAAGAGEGALRPGAKEEPSPLKPSLLESFLREAALSSPVPAPPVAGGVSAVGRSSGTTVKKTSAAQKAGKETEGKQYREGVERPGLGIPLSEVLLSRGVMIEVLLDAAAEKAVKMRLMGKPYPSAGRIRRAVEKEVETKKEREEIKSGETARVKRSFSVENAEKGIYTFVIENKEDSACKADLSFVFYKGGRKERTKKYDAVKVAENGAVRFRFLFPDMIFWDDEDAFTGSIEDSDSLTKFNSDTGLFWKEEKKGSR